MDKYFVLEWRGCGYGGGLFNLFKHHSGRWWKSVVKGCDTTAGDFANSVSARFEDKDVAGRADRDAGGFSERRVEGRPILASRLDGAGQCGHHPGGIDLADAPSEFHDEHVALRAGLPVSVAPAGRPRMPLAAS